MKIGIGIGDIAGAPAGVDGLIAQARRAEADGFASGWFANIMGMDAIMAAARRVACGRLDLHHVGVEVAEELAGEEAGLARQVEDPDAAQVAAERRHAE